MASYAGDACCWESIDIEADFHTEAELIGQPTCDDLLELNEPFKPLWQPANAATYGSAVQTDSTKLLTNPQDRVHKFKASVHVEKTSSNPRKRWTREEEAQLLQCMKEYGKKWSKIATIIQSKTTIQVKTHAHYLLKKRKQCQDIGQPSLLNIEEPTTAEPSKTAQKTIKRSPKKQKGPEDNVIILKEAAGIEDLRSKFPTSEIVNIKRDLGDYTESEEDVNVDSWDEDGGDVAEPSICVADPWEVHEEGNGLTSVDADCADRDTVSEMASSEADATRPSISFDVPTCEITLDEGCITDEEKAVHAEFFTGRPAKTPERYLKIRNHILDAWRKLKPNYMNKTAARQGLKSCGDVNCIGRIHDYLERIGAINFGCPQVVYQKNRFPQPQPKRTAAKENRSAELNRPHRRKPAATDMSGIDVKGGGVTLEHGSCGSIISQTVIPSKVKVPKQRSNPFKLIPCRRFDGDQEPFSIRVLADVMLLMDVHAHLVETEVIGLLGGHYDEDQRILMVSSAEPCDSVSTDLECDMDPVSQAAAMESLLTGGHSVVGWYHSHPTFVPNPSVRDLTTQADYQGMFSTRGQPFVAAILSPHLQQSTLETSPESRASKTRWWISQQQPALDRDENKKLSPRCDLVPYRFETKLVPMDRARLVDLTTKVASLKARIETNSAKVDLLHCYPWQPAVTYLHKMLTSLQFHLTNSGTQTEDAAEALRAIHSIFVVTQHS